MFPATTLDLTPVVLNLMLYRGDGFTLVVAFTARDGQPVAMSGDWVAQIRESPEAATVIGEFAIDDATQANGYITLRLTGDDTRTLLPGVWDLENTPTSGEPRTWYRGTVAFTDDVTRVGVGP